MLQFGRHDAKSSGRAPDAGAARAHYVGADACASCHAREYAAWRGSQHQQAMQHAASGTVLGDFANAKFSYAGISSTFSSRNGAYFVNTDGPDGKLHDYQVLYTFGITPLQQYLIALPGGRLQALSIAWDTRPKGQGGQRWFHLYPGQAIKAGDRLHWTGIDQNWNFQCADCHSTHLQKRFDSKTNVFSTTWSEINVACEACHGPASRHIDWARHQDGWRKIGNKGLDAVLDERHGVNWSRAAGASHRDAQHGTHDQPGNRYLRALSRAPRTTDRRGRARTPAGRRLPAGPARRGPVLGRRPDARRGL